LIKPAARMRWSGISCLSKNLNSRSEPGPADCQHRIDRLRDRELRRVEQNGIIRGTQRRHGARAVALIPTLDLAQKIDNVSRHSFFHQLLMSPLRTLFGARRQKHLDPGVGKYPRARVAALG